MSKQGIWKLSAHPVGTTEPYRIIHGEVHNIREVANDCDGDVLFDYMSENGIIEDWEEYETDGDNEHVAIMHKTGDKPDYTWDFIAYVPKHLFSDDCHTFS